MPGSRERRIAENNRAFRAANEQIRDSADRYALDMERIPFLCECPQDGCVEIVLMTSGEYAAVRSNPHHFLTAVGHEEAERPVGRVVSRNDGYVVVEK
jgi:hypothetical protein